MVWAEGEQKKQVGGKDRNELASAQALVIWAIPLPRRNCISALEKVHPKTVYLIGATTPAETPETLSPDWPAC